MKILYLSISYVPSRRASAVQVMKMCSAFAGAGHDVTLVTKNCLSRLERTELSDHAYYGVEPNFAVTKIDRPERKGGGLLFQLGVAKLLHRHKRDVDIVFSRDLQAAALSARIGLPTIFEAHGLPGIAAKAFEELIRSPSFVRVVFISDALRREYEDLGYTVSDEKVVIAHDGATPAPYTKTHADKDRVTVGYIGSLYPGRGVDILLDVARRLPAHEFLVVGGQDAAVAELKAAGIPTNVTLAGFVPPGDLDQWYEKMDVLLMPYSDQGVSTASGGETSRFMSPLKMFEYMATGIPLISSDLPVLREVLTDEYDALFVSARDVDEWERAVSRLAASATLRARIGGNAKETLLREYTWDVRAKAVLHGKHSMEAAA